MPRFALPAVSLTVGILAVCAMGSTSLAARGGGDEAILIGVQAPITGASATNGRDMANAVGVALQEINARGGVLGKTLEMVIEDAACDPQAAVGAASKLVSRNVVAVVGGYCSGATLPTLKIYGDANVPFIITAANSTKLIPANPGNAFMINSTGDQQSLTAVGFLSGKGVKTLAIVNEGDAFSQDVADLTRDLWKKRRGNRVVSFETVNKGEQDFSSLITTIKAAHPDAVFWTAYYADGGLLIRQLRQSGYRGVIAVADGSSSEKLLEIAGRAGEGVFAFSPPTASFIPAAARFIDAYRDKYDAATGPYAALTYDGTRLLAEVIERAGSTDSAAILAALAAVDGWRGLSGPISFDKNHVLARSNFVVLEGKGGGWIRAAQ